MKNLESFVGAIGKGQFGIVMVSCTEPKMNKRGNEYYGRVKKLTYTSNVAMGYDYAGYLFGKAKKQGVEKSLAEFQAEVSKPKGKTWLNHPFVLQSDKDETQKYIRCYYNANSKSKSVFLLDGKFVHDERLIEAIKAKITTSSGHSEKFDLDDINLRDFKFENVLLLKQGDKVYNKLDCILTPKQLIDFVKSFE